MYEQVEKKKEKKSRAIANSEAQKENDKHGSPFVDERHLALVNWNNRISGVTLQMKNKASDNRKVETPAHGMTGSNGSTKYPTQLMSIAARDMINKNDYYEDAKFIKSTSSGVYLFIINKIGGPRNQNLQVHWHQHTDYFSVRWGNEGSGNNVDAAQWMIDRVRKTPTAVFLMTSLSKKENDEQFPELSTVSKKN